MKNLDSSGHVSLYSREASSRNLAAAPSPGIIFTQDTNTTTTTTAAPRLNFLRQTFKWRRG